MSCFYPIQCFWRNNQSYFDPDIKRKVLFGIAPKGYEQFELPCGQCGYCRMHRAREWAIRCMHESMMHNYSVFVTLTYAEEFLPAMRSLDHSHFQDFMKRLRVRLSRGVTFYLYDRAVGSVCIPEGIRFYMCGEYGPKFGRPHFHAVIFGLPLFDRVLYRKKATGDLYTSDFLTDTWGMGHCTFGEVTIQSAGYCARYTMKKIMGKKAREHYQGRVPEYAKMSNREGIGASWMRKYWETDVYASDNVLVEGKSGRFEVKPPRYYDKLLKKIDSRKYGDIIEARREALKDREEVTPYTLAVRKRKHEINMKKLFREYDECDTLKKEFAVKDDFDYFSQFTPNDEE